ncbi:MAG: hypothetical protein QM831_37200 [Kofleriaceae bacterium]
MRWLVLVVVLAGVTPARADDDFGASALGGLVLGVSFGHRTTPLYGLEAGGGLGPERFNIGFEHRDDTRVVYAELDPWFFLGMSFGGAYEIDHDMEHVDLGAWEGLPVYSSANSCGHAGVLGTISVGVRYTGTVELYVSPKIGYGEMPCLF